MTKLGEWCEFREWRVKNKLTCKELAPLLGASDSSVNAWERGVYKINSIDIANQIEKIMGIKVPLERTSYFKKRGGSKRKNAAMKDRPITLDEVKITLRYYFEKGFRDAKKLAREMNRRPEDIESLVKYIERYQQQRAI